MRSPINRSAMVALFLVIDRTTTGPSRPSVVNFAIRATSTWATREPSGASAALPYCWNKPRSCRAASVLSGDLDVSRGVSKKTCPRPLHRTTERVGETRTEVDSCAGQVPVSESAVDDDGVALLMRSPISCASTSARGNDVHLGGGLSRRTERSKEFDGPWMAVFDRGYCAVACDDDCQWSDGAAEGTLLARALQLASRVDRPADEWRGCGGRRSSS